MSFTYPKWYMLPSSLRIQIKERTKEIYSLLSWGWTFSSSYIWTLELTCGSLPLLGSLASGHRINWPMPTIQSQAFRISLNHVSSLTGSPTIWRSMCSFWASNIPLMSHFPFLPVSPALHTAFTPPGPITIWFCFPGVSLSDEYTKPYKPPRWTLGLDSGDGPGQEVQLSRSLHMWNKEERTVPVALQLEELNRSSCPKP